MKLRRLRCYVVTYRAIDTDGVIVNGSVCVTHRSMDEAAHVVDAWLDGWTRAVLAFSVRRVPRVQGAMVVV